MTDQATIDKLAHDLVEGNDDATNGKDEAIFNALTDDEKGAVLEEAVGIITGEEPAAFEDTHPGAGDPGSVDPTPFPVA